MKRRSARDWALAFWEAAAKAKPEEQQAMAKTFWKLLARHRASKLAPRILEHMQTLSDQQAGQTRVQVTVARSSTMALIEKKIHSSPKKVIIESTIDRSLKAGVIIQVQDERVDASLRTQLQHLYTSLSQ